ncbi:isochorismatase family cysteine hydrolase, partial [Pseudomonas sp. F01002]|uniref:isochorismatase family cysteine hydrolase n=2 Tax=unclassified Pseudomonas TaxID=196821 RepID=UPI002113F17D
PQPDELIIDKGRYSAFHRTDLDARLKVLGVDTLIVCGVLTDVCVLSTVFDAFALGYHIRLVSDACTTTSISSLRPNAMANPARCFSSGSVPT